MTVFESIVLEPECQQEDVFCSPLWGLPNLFSADLHVASCSCWLTDPLRDCVPVMQWFLLFQCSLPNTYLKFIEHGYCGLLLRWCI